MGTVAIQIVVIVGSVVIWLALVFMAERQARRRRAQTNVAEATKQG